MVAIILIVAVKIQLVKSHAALLFEWSLILWSALIGIQVMPIDKSFLFFLFGELYFFLFYKFLSNICFT